MNFLGIIGLAAAGNNLFYLDQKLVAEVDPHAKDLSLKPKWENPIYLDALKNDLLPNKILTTFKAPNFMGVAPPGITTFMAFQVFLSGERKGGFVYPLFLKYAIEDFDGKNKNIIMDDVCTKYGKKACPPGSKLNKYLFVWLGQPLLMSD